MSLIYQALKQNEQQAPVAAAVGVPMAALSPVVAASAPTAAGWMRRSVLLGVLLLGAGVLAGLLLGQRTSPAPAMPAAAPSVPAAPALQATLVEPPPLPKAAPVVAEPVPAAMPELPVARTPAAALPKAEPPLPKAEPPLPTVGPRLTLSTTLVTPTPTPTPPPASAAPAPAPKAAPVAEARPASVEVSVRSVATMPEPAGTANLDVAELFDGLNRALESRDEATATRNLQAIRVRLSESSLARMRAEGWYAFRTGDLDKAQRFYRRLLEKLPGDENASLALASIERQEQRPEQAREILSRSLKANPGSTVLRSALDQSPSEASR